LKCHDFLFLTCTHSIRCGLAAIKVNKSFLHVFPTSPLRSYVNAVSLPLKKNVMEVVQSGQKRLIKRDKRDWLKYQVYTGMSLPCLLAIQSTKTS